MTVKKNRADQTRWSTADDVIELIEALARQMPDQSIAAVLNRSQKQTGRGNTWTRMRVCSVRNQKGMISPYQDGGRKARGEVTLNEAADILTVSPSTVLRMIGTGLLPARGLPSSESSGGNSGSPRTAFRPWGEQAWSLELEQARYEDHLAARRYEALDPDNRLDASELDARWNTALQGVAELELRLRKDEQSPQAARVPDRETLHNLAHDLATVWNSPATDMRLKQRIVRILAVGIIAGVDQENQEIVLLIHWAGGQHSELRIKKNATGKHSRCTSLEAIEIIRRMADRFPDDQIAATLNRLGLRTGAGNIWREGNVRSARSYHQLPAYVPGQSKVDTLTLEQASERLAASHKIVRRLIEDGKISATQVVPCAPWEIPAEAIGSELILQR